MSNEKFDEKWNWFIIGVAIAIANIGLAFSMSLEILYPNIYIWLLIIVGVFVLFHYVLLKFTDAKDIMSFPIIMGYLVMMAVLIILGFPLHCTNC